MKKNCLIIAVLISSLSFAQISFPKESSQAEVEQGIGLTKVDIEYHRPNVKGRTVFGGIVPNGSVWRTGANENTTIEFSTNVTIEGKQLLAGKYALYTIPDSKETEVIFYKKTDNWGNPEKWDDAEVALKVKVKTTKLNDLVETFTIDFSDVTTDDAKLNLSWEKRKVTLSIKTPTQATLVNELKTKLNDQSSARDFFGAANYYFVKNLDLKQAKIWIETAIKKSGDRVPGYFSELKENIEKKLK